MAHRIKIERPAHINKDGSESTSKRDYRVVDRTRRGRVVVGLATSQKECDRLVEEHRQKMVGDHARKHPNDRAFLRKLYAEKVSD